MHFTTEQGDAKTVFRLKESRLDSRNAGQLKAEFLILAQPDIDALIVDLADVQQIDSAGISALLLADRQMKLHGGEARLVGVRPDVLSMLRLTQLDRIFPIYNTVEEALAAEVVFRDDDEPELGADRNEDDELSVALGRTTIPSLGPQAPTVSEIQAGAIAAGGSFGAAALAKIMMTPYDDELTLTSPMAFGEPGLGGLTMGDEEDLDDDDDFEDDDFDDDDDLDDEEVADEDLDEEDDAEEADEDVAEDAIEDDDFEDDDFDDEELEEDEEEDY